MAICKCKMCGGDLNITDLENVVVCDYCGTTQTVPSADSEKKMTLFNRANRLRLNNEFDKAAGIYESIVAEFPEEAEAYWGIVLCKYGIEYVDDPATGKKIPTCHRSSFESVFEDDAFDQACENADAVARRVYREEAKQIEDIRKGILEVSSKEEPYDIFICYKETDENGDRTIDSAIAQDVYDALTEKGYRVFFSRITLEDKLGQEYEPYIFAALNSAKVMLVFGTDYEYFNAVWVKNEWSRFLQLISAGQKKVLIPCYKGIDVYDMPKEFARLQSQDMGKVGAIQDLLRGIEKILPKREEKKEVRPVVQQVVQQTVQGGGPNVRALLDRGQYALEDGLWEKAKEYFDQVLNMDAKNHDAYLGIALADEQLKDRNTFADAFIDRKIEDSSELKRARSFADSDQRAWWSKLDADRKAADERKAEAKRVAEDKRMATEKAAKEEDIRSRAAAIPMLEMRRKEIAQVQNLIVSKGERIIALNADGTVSVTEELVRDRLLVDYSQVDASKWKDIIAITGTNLNTFGIKRSGTVVAVGYNESGQCNVNHWRNIVSVSAHGWRTVGLKADGTVVAVGYNKNGGCNVSDWRDIVSINAEAKQTVGIKKDGTVVLAGSGPFDKQIVSTWKDIVSVAVGNDHLVGLKKDGTVVATGENEDGQCNVSDWQNIVAITAGAYLTVGLKNDGTVVAVGVIKSLYSKYSPSYVSSWRNICAISVGYPKIIGLKQDGTVEGLSQSESPWHDIVAVIQGGNRTIGVRKDGKVLVNEDGAKRWLRGDVKDWKLFQDYRLFEQERKNIYRTSLQKEKATLEAELLALKGIFKAGRRWEVEERLATIEAKLNELTKQ